MDKNLIDETRSFLELIQTYHHELSTLRFEEKGIETVNDHLQKSIQESEEAAEKILTNINRTLERNEKLKAFKSLLPPEQAAELGEHIDAIERCTVENLTLMEFQDILVQRLIKSSGLLEELKAKLLRLVLLLGIQESENAQEREKMEAKLNEIAWEKEVDQEDVDAILEQFGL